jgi:ribosomal protein L40E
VLFALGFYTIYRYVQKYGVEKDNSKNQAAQNSNFTQSSLEKTASKPHPQGPNYINHQYQNSGYNTIFEKNTSANERSTQFCRRCGNKLTEDSVFCSKCGTKIITEND